MSSAFECDRCGELQGGPPAIQVATKGIQERGGSVSVEQRDNDGPAPRKRGLGLLGHNCTYSINGGDLCEDCAEAFREFWGEDA